MSSDPNFVALNDIQHNIELARSFVSGYAYERFRDDQKTIYAVTRCLEIISEATRRSTDDLKKCHPDLPWSRIAGAGNIYRHDYETVLSEIVRETVLNGLEPLLTVVRTELQQSGAS